MAIERRDDFITDAQGRALAGALVYYCTQPANTSSLPPSPLATVYSDVAGTATTNPQVTDGFGHAVAYLNASPLYTLVYVHPLFGSNPIVLPDQIIGGGNPAIGFGEAIATAGQTVFTVPNYTPGANDLWVIAGGMVLTNGIDYTETNSTHITLTQGAGLNEVFTFRVL
jgi:hypothetical protein